jgi:hypothetical protein
VTPGRGKATARAKSLKKNPKIFSGRQVDPTKIPFLILDRDHVIAFIATIIPATRFARA